MTLVYVPFYLQNYKLLSEHVLGSKELTKSPWFSKACASCLSQTNHRQHTHSILAGLWCIYFPSKSQLKFGEYLPGVSNVAFVDKLQKLIVFCAPAVLHSQLKSVVLSPGKIQTPLAEATLPGWPSQSSLVLNAFMRALHCSSCTCSATSHLPLENHHLFKACAMSDRAMAHPPACLSWTLRKPSHGGENAKGTNSTQ